jgi:hypothetical protein
MSNNFRAANEELDRLESNYKLLDPQSAPSEVARLVEEELQRAGLKPAPQMNDPLRKRIFEAAGKFVASRPETDPVNGFLPSQDNETIMHNYMAENELDFRFPHSYEQAFLAVRDRLTPPPPGRHAIQVRVRKVNVGGREVEISHETLDHLSARELEQLSRNPRFVEAVNALPPKSR